MKTILVFLVLAVMYQSANAQLRLEAGNKAGGKIVATSRLCPVEDTLRLAYKTDSSGSYNEGCWGIVDNRIHVVWSDTPNSRSVYEYSAFTVINERTGKPATDDDMVQYSTKKKNQF